MRRLIFICCLALILAGLLAGCGSEKKSAPAAQPDQDARQMEIQPVVSNAPVEWKSDGKINDNEYSGHQTVGDLEVYTRLEGDTIMLGLTADTQGYLSLGIDPDGSMRDVDMIMCAIVDGIAVVSDLCGSGKHFPHPYDTDSGGKNDLTDISGSRKDLTSVFEFKRKLDTGDSRDKALKIGENRVVWAVGLYNDFASPHCGRGSGSLILRTN